MKSIKERVYLKYQIHWLMSHGYTVEDLNCTAFDWFNERLADPDNDNTLTDYLFEHGINGSLWACYDEFIETEYQNAAYMEELLSRNEYAEYCMDIVNMHSRDYSNMYAKKCKEMAVLAENFTALSASFNEMVDAQEQESRWIPVTEDLPATDGRYEVTISDINEHKYVEMCNFYKNASPDIKWGGGLYGRHVIAWRQRPVPYKGKD